MENLPAHVRWTNPHTRGAALLLRGLRLVGLHPAAVHGLSLQPGQQQTGTEKSNAITSKAMMQGNKTAH